VVFPSARRIARARSTTLFPIDNVILIQTVSAPTVIAINHQIHILGALGIELGDRLHPALAQQNTDAIGDCAFDSADDRHFEAGGPPRADGDQGLGCADGEVRARETTAAAMTAGIPCMKKKGMTE